MEKTKIKNALSELRSRDRLPSHAKKKVKSMGSIGSRGESGIRIRLPRSYVL